MCIICEKTKEAGIENWKDITTHKKGDIEKIVEIIKEQADQYFAPGFKNALQDIPMNLLIEEFQKIFEERNEERGYIFKASNGIKIIDGSNSGIGQLTRTKEGMSTKYYIIEHPNYPDEAMFLAYWHQDAHKQLEVYRQIWAAKEITKTDEELEQLTLDCQLAIDEARDYGIKKLFEIREAQILKEQTKKGVVNA